MARPSATQQAYTRGLRMLSEFYDNRAPEALGEAELEAYFLHRRNADRWLPKTMRICYAGIRFQDGPWKPESPGQ